MYVLKMKVKKHSSVPWRPLLLLVQFQFIGKNVVPYRIFPLLTTTPLELFYLFISEQEYSRA